MTQKIVISKSGYSSLTETDPNNLIFSSDYNTLKYHVSGSLSLNVSGGPLEAFDEGTYFEHGLDYYPFFQVFVKIDSWSSWQPISYWTAGAGFYIRLYSYVTDDAKLIVRAVGWLEDADDFDIEFRYKIFRNNLGL